MAGAGGSLVAAGHTASDQVETVLYRLAAAPGRRALLGMAAREGRLVRPLLDVTREETAAYCAERGLPWRDDPTNASPAFARNRTRHELLPALRGLHPAAEANVLRTLAILRDEAIGEILVQADDLQHRVRALGREISEDYADRDLLLVGVLKGAVFFLSDLMRHIDVPCEVDFMAVASYGSSTDSSGVVRILKDLDAPLEGRDVLIVEDIVDSGLTLQYLLRTLQARNPASLEVCALLTKPDRRKIDLPARYIGFEIPDKFAIGYGLDYAERYRNLPYVAALTGVDA